MKKVLLKIFWLISLVVLSGCGNSGSPEPSPTVTVYVPAPSPGFNSGNNFNQNDVQDQLDEIRRNNCQMANELSMQSMKLQNEASLIGQNNSLLNPNYDEIWQQQVQLGNQAIELMRQSDALRQQC